MPSLRGVPSVHFQKVYEVVVGGGSKKKRLLPPTSTIRCYNLLYSLSNKPIDAFLVRSLEREEKKKMMRALVPNSAPFLEDINENVVCFLRRRWIISRLR